MSKERRNINVIFNPISGGNNKNTIVAELKKKLKNENLKFYKTEFEGHGFKLSKSLKNESDVIIIIGGDGTVNEVGKALIDSEVKLWLIPSGSGNGLARSLNIPLGYKKNIDLFVSGDYKVKSIDAIQSNEYFSFVTAGLGLDALVAHKFKNSGRGSFNYIKITLRSFFKAQNTKFTINIDNDQIIKEAVLVSMCNVGQYGNNFYISNISDPHDGFLEIVIIKKSKSLISNISLLFRILFRKLKETKHYEIHKAKEVEIEHGNPYFHIDGEAYECENKKSTFRIKKDAINILIPD